MAGQVVPFIFKDRPVRTVEIAGEPWFVGRDVCAILDIAKPEQAFGRLDGDERGTYSVGTPGGLQAMIVLSEPGVYRLIFTSRKAEAEEFKRWLAHEVLPQIRKTGRFAPVEPAAIDGLDGHAVQLVNLKLELVREYRRAKGPQAGSAMWSYLGLPDPTARGSASTPSHSGQQALAHLMRAETFEQKRFGQVLEKALGDGDFYEEIDLGVTGMRLAEDASGIVFANGHHGLAKIFAGTPWADGRWSQALKRLPGAHVIGAQRFAGVTCRGVFVPADVVMDAAIAADPR